jgi:predicted small secreted protein
LIRGRQPESLASTKIEDEEENEDDPGARHRPHGGERRRGQGFTIVEPGTTISREPDLKSKVMIKKIMLLLFAAGTLITAAGCHTAHGAGEDISSTGNKIQEHTPP